MRAIGKKLLNFKVSRGYIHFNRMSRDITLTFYQSKDGILVIKVNFLRRLYSSK